MNFLLAFILFFILLMIQGTPVSLPEVEIRGIFEDSPAHLAGLSANDIISHINGVPVENVQEVTDGISAFDGSAIELNVIRGGEHLNFSLIPVLTEGRYIIGFTIRQRMVSERISIFAGISGASAQIIEIIRGPFILLAQLLSSEPMPEGGMLMGPIGLGGAVTDVYHAAIKHGFLDMVFIMLSITGLISAALGIFNLLPIPALDGARIIFLLVEAVRRKRVPPEKEAMVHFVGLVLLLMLAVVIAYQDIARIIGVNDFTG
jgi:regulator of sigma E protease